MTLTEFLLARFDDDRVGIRLAKCEECGTYRHRLGGSVEARALSDVEAKRRIVEDHNAVHAGCPGSPTLTSDDGEQDGTYGGPCAVLRNLASVYSDHPSYREA